MRVYNRALSAAEIRRGMRRRRPGQAGPGGPTAAAPAPSPSGVAGARPATCPAVRQIFLDDFTQDVASWGDCVLRGPRPARRCPSTVPLQVVGLSHALPGHAARTDGRRTAGSTSRRNLSMANGMLQAAAASRERHHPGRGSDPEDSARAPTAATRCGSRRIRSPASRWPGSRGPSRAAAPTTARSISPRGTCIAGSAPLCTSRRRAGGRRMPSARPRSSPRAGTPPSSSGRPARSSSGSTNRLIGTSTTRVPSTPMNWILQSETSLTEDPPRGGRRREHLRRLGRRLDARLSGVTRAGARPPGAAPA